MQRLIACRANDEPVRRMTLEYSEATGWIPLGPRPSISMINDQAAQGIAPQAVISL